MTMLRFLNPIYLISCILDMFRDVDNFFYYNKQVNKLRNANTSGFYNLKIDKLNRMYTAINLPPEILLIDDKQRLERQEKEIIGAQLGRIERLLQDYNIYELIRYNYQRVKNESIYAYKVSITYRTRYFSPIMILWTTGYFYLATKWIMSVEWVGGFMSIMEFFKNLDI